MAQATPRRFAPLNKTHGQQSDHPQLKGVIFDVDGTLCEPQNHMFKEMRAVLGIPKSTDILEHIYSLPQPSHQEEAMEAIRAIERRTMVQQVAQPGLVDLMSYLDAQGLRKGICTRNFAQPVNHLLTKFLSGHDFAPIITRDFRPPKPDPAGLLHIARSWGLVRPIASPSSPLDTSHLLSNSNSSETQTSEAVGPSTTTPDPKTEGATEVGDASSLIMVGDSIDDMTAGRAAGAATVLLVNDANRHLADHAHTDLVIERLDELIGHLERGFVGREVGVKGKGEGEGVDEGA
ncbi:HAD-like protein [Whalleya microplaca]|nr:HAD-like protein [Whalleya microplaca]